jgi:hypothetical protein
MLLYSFLSPCSAQCLGTSYRSQLFLILTSYFVAHRKRVSAKLVPDFVSSYFRNFCCISQVVLAPNSAPPRSQVSFALTSFYFITFSNMHHFWPWQPKHIEHCLLLNENRRWKPRSEINLQRLLIVFSQRLERKLKRKVKRGVRRLVARLDIEDIRQSAHGNYYMPARSRDSFLESWSESVTHRNESNNRRVRDQNLW